MNFQHFTKAQDLEMGEAIYNLFLPNDIFTEKKLLDYIAMIYEEYKICNDSGDIKQAAVEDLPQLGIIAESFDRKRKGKIEVAYRIVKTFIILHSPEWYDQSK